MRQDVIPGGSLSVAKNQEISGEEKCGLNWELWRGPEAQSGLGCVCTHKGRICISIKTGIAALTRHYHMECGGVSLHTLTGLGGLFQALQMWDC